jgi:hypothetical protein
MPNRIAFRRLWLIRIHEPSRVFVIPSSISARGSASARITEATLLMFTDSANGTPAFKR